MTVVIEQTRTGFSAHVEEVPGLGVAGATLEETVDLIRGALVMHFEAYPASIPLTYKTTVAGCEVKSTVPVVA